MYTKTFTDILLDNSYNNTRYLSFVTEVGEEKLYHQDLIYMAKQFLKLLQVKKVTKGTPIVLQLKEKKDFMIAFMGCILGGVIPVPIDCVVSQFQVERLNGVVDIMPEAQIVTSTKTLSGTLEVLKEAAADKLIKKFSKESILIEDIKGLEPSEDIAKVTRNDICFIQYSSGSTNFPKGICISHKAVITNSEDLCERAGVTPETRLVGWTPLTHNLGLIPFAVIPFVKKLSVCLIETELFLKNPYILLQQIDKHKANITVAPNFAYQHILATVKKVGLPDCDLSSVKAMLSGGEEVSHPLCQALQEHLRPLGLPPNVIKAVYGMTEATLGITVPKVEETIVGHTYKAESLVEGQRVVKTDIQEGGRYLIDVGRPLARTSVRICNDKDEVLVDETVGRIQIKGDAVTSGYYRLKEENEKLYTEDGWLRTGDLGFLMEGKLILIGREKDMLIINGKNIYAYDLEAYINKYLNLQEAHIAVVGMEDVQTQTESAVVFIETTEPIDVFKAKAEQLQRYIFEVYGLKIGEVVPIQVMPRTSVGKKAYFKLKQGYQAGRYCGVLQQSKQNIEKKVIEEVDSEEKELLEIWREVLDEPELGMDDNFFIHGGNSVTALRMLGLVKERLGKQVTVREVFKHQTVRELIEVLKALETQQGEVLKVTPSATHYPLSHAQMRIYMSANVIDNPLVYNIPVVGKIKNILLEPDKLQDALNKLVEKYEILKVSIQIIDEVPAQVINQDLHIDLQYKQIQEEQVEEYLQEFIRPFKELVAPLLRVGLVHTAQDTILILDMHHIIGDGTTVSLMIEELLKLYFNEPVKNNKFQYRDYVAYESTEQYKQSLEAMEVFWLEQFEEINEPIYLPEDFDRPEIKQYKGRRISFEIKEDIILGLKQLAKACGVTEFAMFLTLYNILINVYTGEEDIVVGTPVNGRTLNEVQDMLGLFINMVPVRSKFDGEMSFKEVLQIISNSSIASLDRGTYPFDQLIQKLGIVPSPSITPLFNVAFVYQNFRYPKIGEIEYTLENSNPLTSQYDLLLSIYALENQFKFEFEYDVDLFLEETVLQFIYSFYEIIVQVLDNPNQSINELEISGEFNETFHIRVNG